MTLPARIPVITPGVLRLFPKNLGATSEFDTPERGNMKQAPYWGYTDIRRHRAKCSGHGDLAPGICAPLHNDIYHTTHCHYPNMEIPSCWKWGHQGNGSLQHLFLAWVYYSDSSWAELQNNILITKFYTGTSETEKCCWYPHCFKFLTLQLRRGAQWGIQSEDFGLNPLAW